MRSTPWYSKFMTKADVGTIPVTTGREISTPAAFWVQMNNLPISSLKSRHPRWLSFASAFLLIAGLGILYLFAKRERVTDWPRGGDFDWARELDLADAATKPGAAFTVVGIRYIHGELYA